MTQSATHHWLSIDCWTCELRSDGNSYLRLCSVDRTVRDAPANVCLWRPATWTNTPKRTEKKLIVRSGISEAETSNNKRLRRFVLKLYRHEASCGLFATADLLVIPISRSGLHYHDMKRSALGVTRSKDKADDRVGGLAEASFLTFLSWGGFLLIIIFLLQTKQKVILHVQHFSDAVDKFATTLRQISSELGVLKIIEIITSFDGIVKRGLLRYTA